ncbi:PfkB family carbohydrate kinase [Nocardia farcinica]|uniref:PfkB family carbohydrate kinase n=1 Tax=Nocardia farcinica TaxID=37329 RepID=UPI001893C2C5|nr:PfkB family carbohydrate kinase [Nocardia farcinica]MBF6249040.1 sugar kinase [Nocardia farcinica]
MTAALFVGLSTVDIAYAVDRYPEKDTKTQAREQFLGAGGPAANAAVACAVVSGEPTVLVTALGRHPLTEVARHDLAAHRVTVVDVTPERAEQPPVSSIVVALEGQSRTIVGLDAARTRAPFTTELVEHVDRASIVLVDGHHPELAIGMARRAKELGVPVVLDGGRWKPIHEDLLPLVDVAICSEAFRPPGFEGDATALVDYLRARGPTCAALTRGPKAIVYTAGGRRGSVQVTPVGGDADTLGAGDILHGAFCAYFRRTGDFVAALTRAAAVSTLSCRTFGTRNWARELSELNG